MCPKRGAGFSLIEAVIFIVVIGISIAALLVLYTSVTRASVDPLVRKQVLALATSMLEEIELRAFTYCDPDDPAVYSAATTADCTTAETATSGLESGETFANRSTLDNVNDYNGLAMSGGGILDMNGNPVSGLDGYSVNVAVANISPGQLDDVSDVTKALRITVTASGPAGVSVTLQGYRLRYAPNSP